MILLWRISNYTALDGSGGLLASGRWHTRGRPVIYLADSPASALLEVLIRLELDYDNLPQTYKLLKVEAPEGLKVQTLDVTTLSENWVADQVETRTMGDEWLASQKTPLLRVPSALIPETSNLLLNPRHAEATRLKILWHRQYPWDRRLF